MASTTIYTYFGNKRKIANKVWDRYFRGIHTYIEPFAGSAAVAMAKPVDQPVTNMYLNDYFMHVANALRAIAHYPEDLVDYLDTTRLEIDLHMHNDILSSVEGQGYLREVLMSDIYACDVEYAGWWITGTNLWIGGGYGEAEFRTGQSTPRNKPAKSNQCTFQTPRNKPVDRNRATLQTPRKKPAKANQCTFQTPRKKPGHRSRGTYSYDKAVPSARRQHIMDLLDRAFVALQDANILYGDFGRVLTKSYISSTPTGIFMDPPYPTKDIIYHKNEADVFYRAKEWFLEHYKDPKVRIILCGNAHDFLDMPDDVRQVSWTRNSGYAQGKAKDNRKNEIMCLSLAAQEAEDEIDNNVLFNQTEEV